MPPKNNKTLISIISAAIIILAGFGLAGEVLADPGWLSGYSYRKQVTVTNASASYQTKILVGESAGATGEEVDCGGHVLSTFNDLRFTGSDGTTTLDYWIESITGTTPNQLATVWVENDGTPSATCYMYYGKSDATAASNGANTFITFDDFERGINGDAVGGAWVTWGGSATIATAQHYGGTRSGEFGAFNGYLGGILSSTKAIQIRFYKPNASRGPYSEACDASTYGYRVWADSSENLLYGAGTDTGVNVTADAWQLLEIRKLDYGSQTYDIYLNGLLAKSGAAMNTGGNLVGMQVWNGAGAYYIDNFIIRKYVSPEPTWGSWGSEETLPTYYTSGYFISTNLLSGVSPAPTSIDSFVYNLSAKPSNTTSTVGFNQNGGSTWYNAAGVEGTETLVTGSNQTITLTSGWSGANFYYKVIFTSDGADTPVLDDITVNYTSNAAPTVDSVTLNGGNNITLTENITTLVSATGTVSDTNTYSDITSVQGKLYRSGVGSDCSTDDNNCYEDTSCATSSCAGNTCNYTCDYNLQFFAEPTDTGKYASSSGWTSQNWVAWVKVTDTASASSTATNTATVDVNTLTAINVDSSITYDALDPNTNMANLTKALNATNTGNVPIDVQLKGDNMTYGATGTIAVANQRYSTTTDDAWANGTALTANYVNLEVDLPRYGLSATTSEILRPNAAGDYTNLSPYPGTGEANWADVDEVVTDEGATFVETASASQLKDAYNLGSTSIPSGSTVNSVKVYFRVERRSVAYNNMYYQPFLRLGTNETTGTEINTPGTATQYFTYNEILARPGGGSWAVSDLNDLQVVIGERTSYADRKARCTQVYVEVDYIPSSQTDTIYWGWAVPTGTPSGTYTGTNYFNAVED